jgi:hypothetical protein
VAVEETDPEEMRQKYLDHAQEALKRSRAKIEKTTGTLATFELRDPVRARIKLNQAAKRGALTKKKDCFGFIHRVHNQPDTQERTHVYDIILHDGTIVKDVSVKDIAASVHNPFVGLRQF